MRREEEPQAQRHRGEEREERRPTRLVSGLKSRNTNGRGSPGGPGSHKGGSAATHRLEACATGGQATSSCATRYQPIFSNGTARLPNSRFTVPGIGAAQRTALVMTLRTFWSL